MSNRIKLIYDKLYKDNPTIFGEGSLVFLKSVLEKNIMKQGRALDIGAGEGRTSAYLASVGFVVDAVDLSDEAFKSVESDKNIFLHHISITDFEIKYTYSLVNIALVIHHIPKESMFSVIKNLQQNTEKEGIHLYRLFTTNSTFYKQSEGRGYYDDFKNLNELYDGWEIVFDEAFIGKASTQDVQNEVRQVAFRKK